MPLARGFGRRYRPGPRNLWGPSGERENRNTSLTNNKTLKYKYASPAWDFGPLFRPTSESAPDARAPPSYPNRSQLPQPLRSHSLRPYFIRITLQKARHRHTIVRVLAGRGRLGATYLAAPSVPRSPTTSPFTLHRAQPDPETEEGRERKGTRS